jgi:hypothetical protein
MDISNHGLLLEYLRRRILLLRKLTKRLILRLLRKLIVSSLLTLQIIVLLDGVSDSLLLSHLKALLMLENIILLGVIIINRVHRLHVWIQVLISHHGVNLNRLKNDSTMINLIVNWLIVMSLEPLN